uniref:Remorin C-terminal domain-containing protein n=1 Tax=Ananas comosus var. bracteatus TaxID=296719 RepID=A0A6V7Q4V4_ANACO|nr:unnamed protein product [Ananas comosus var. bracteatus]
MSEFGGNSDGSYEIAVAAAAYAIVLLEEERLLKQKKSDEEVILSTFAETKDSRDFVIIILVKLKSLCSIIRETEADAWEKAKMEKIKHRYEKTISTISEWENEKTMKAQRRKDRKERELERKRARILQEYRNEMARIGKIVFEARALAKKEKEMMKPRP